MARPATDAGSRPAAPPARRGAGAWLTTTTGGRRALAAAALVLALAGVGFLAYPWLTDVYTTEVVQRRLRDDLKTPATQAAYERREIKEGDGLTRIVIPRLGVDTIVVEGVSPAALKAGAGHYPETPLPGEVGNMAIAGHRTTYGKPFNRIDQLSVGDDITLITPLARHTYRVVPAPGDATTVCPSGACWITTPTDWGVVGPTATSMLTLTTCHPKGSARLRLIVQAELVDTVDLLPGMPAPQEQS